MDGHYREARRSTPRPCRRTLPVANDRRRAGVVHLMASPPHVLRPFACVRVAISLATLGVLTAIAPAATATTIATDAQGTLRIVGTAGVDALALHRVDATLLVVDAAGAVQLDPSAAASCASTPDGAVECAAIGALSPVAVDLGEGDDRLDATAAGVLALSVEGGAGSDHLRVGSGGRAVVLDATVSDTIDLAHAEEGVSVRWSISDGRLLARCDGCPVRWQVVLPAGPGRVVLGGHADDVDLRQWRGTGRTTWTLGADRDRYLGSPTRRGVVDGGGGWDTLISYAAADVLRGGPGFDKLVDFGGAGDVLLGGPETDSLSSLDGRRDVLDGQGGRDVCLTIGYTARHCDSGPVRSMETTLYHPLTAPFRILRALGITL